MSYYPTKIIFQIFYVNTCLKYTDLRVLYFWSPGNRNQHNKDQLVSHPVSLKLPHVFCYKWFLVFQGAFSGILVGFCVSLWLAVGSTLYPPSEESMGVLPSYVGECEASNITLNISLNQQTPSHSIYTRLHPDNQGSVSSTMPAVIQNGFSPHVVYFG